MKIIKPKHLFNINKTRMYVYKSELPGNSGGKKYLIEYTLAMSYNYAANLGSKSKLRTKTLIGHKNSHRRS